MMSSQDRLKVVGLIALIVTVAIGLAFVVRINNLQGVPSKPVVLTPPTTTPSTIPTTPSTPLPPSESVLEDTTRSIRITNMTAGQHLPNGFIVEGSAVAFESRFSWRLLDSKKRVMASGSASSRQPDAGVPGPFAFPVLFSTVPKTATGTLMVYEASARDGSDTHVVNVPVAFSTSTVAVEIFFGNAKKNPEMLDCSLVYPVTRKVPAGIMPFIAVHELLNGPTASEKAKGFYTNIPVGVMIENAADATGSPSLDFNDVLQRGVAGSCLVTAIRAQIDQTAMPSTVIYPISINGVTDEILQP